METDDISTNATTALGPHVTDSPFFIAGVIILIIVLALFLRRMLFSQVPKEYKYNPED